MLFLSHLQQRFLCGLLPHPKESFQATFDPHSCRDISSTLEYGWTKRKREGQFPTLECRADRQRGPEL